MIDDQDQSETHALDAGRRMEWTPGTVNTPVFRASTILSDSVAAMRAAGVGTLHYEGPDDLIANLVRGFDAFA